MPAPAASPRSAVSMRTRSLVFIALCIAVMAVSAWVTIQIGPIPFTLQMFAMTFAIIMLTPKECLCAVAGYLLLGAIGVPVFSGMRGGVGVLMGPTGGFLWGYFFAVAAASALLYFSRRRSDALTVGKKSAARRSFGSEDAPAGRKIALFIQAFGIEFLAGVVFTLISYVCGWAQYQVVANATPEQAFLVCIAPFVIIDLCKIVAAVIVAEAVKVAVGRPA